MIAQFRQWLIDHYDSMSEMGIIQVGTYENKLPDNQLVSLVITHETAKKIGQITVRQDRHLDIEIVSAITNELEYYLYFMAHNPVDLSMLLQSYIDYIKE